MNPDGLDETQTREVAEFFECLLREHSVEDSTRAIQQLWPLVFEEPEQFGPLVL